MNATIHKGKKRLTSTLRISYAEQTESAGFSQVLLKRLRRFIIICTGQMWNEKYYQRLHKTQSESRKTEIFLNTKVSWTGAFLKNYDTVLQIFDLEKRMIFSVTRLDEKNKSLLICKMILNYSCMKYKLKLENFTHSNSELSKLSKIML